ncbi:MAG TPA: HAMP domain-containing sensor histidine kinase [Streptosporangiaceae bacterium]
MAADPALGATATGRETVSPAGSEPASPAGRVNPGPAGQEGAAATGHGRRAADIVPGLVNNERQWHTPGAWWRRRGLRARLTLAVSALLVVVLTAAALLLFNALRVSLTRGLDDTARQGAREVAVLANAGRLPDPVPVADSTLTVQVLDAQGRIVDASPAADRLVPLIPFFVAKSIAARGQGISLAGGPMDIALPLRVVAVPTDGDGVVIATVSYAEVGGSLTAIGRVTIIGTPVLFLVFVLLTWLVTGAALRPIEELRRGAQEITGTAIARGRTLPVPEARDEVHSLAVILNDMLARLEAAQQRQRGFVSDAAHELRSPIASIRTQLEVAVDHPDAIDWRQTAGGVLADTLRLARLTEDLLALARLDERAGRPSRGRPVDLAGAAAAVALRYGEARVPVTTQSLNACVVLGDADGLDRMLVNLIDNAVRYTHSRVSVTARADGPWVVLSVCDDGPGIPEADAERVFGRFTRLDDARSRDHADQAGSGLGLAIVRATAAAHGGTVWLEDAAPGLRAVVRLPAAPRQQGSDRDHGEQQGQVGDGQVEQPHRSGRDG